MSQVSPSKLAAKVIPISSERVRCAFRDSKGRRCRNSLLAGANSAYCSIHIAKIERDTKLRRQAAARELFGDSRGLSTSFGITRFLRKLGPMVVEQRIANRDAYLLTYIANLLLQSTEAAKHELYAATDNDRDAVDQAIHKSLSPFFEELIGYDPDVVDSHALLARRRDEKYFRSLAAKNAAKQLRAANADDHDDHACESHSVDSVDESPAAP